MRRALKQLALWAVLAAVAASCSSHSDFKIFLAPAGDTLTNATEDQLEQALQSLVGSAPSVDLNVNMYSVPSKTSAEIATGAYSIVIVPEPQFNLLAKKGGLVVLDDIFAPSEYPDGYVAADGDGAKHVYGIPIENSAWLKPFGDSRSKLFAFVDPRAKNIEMVKQVLKKIAGT